MCARTCDSPAVSYPPGCTAATRDAVCALALEFKKTFMDEWTGEVDEAMLADLAAALAATREPVLAALASVPVADWPPA